MNMFLHSEDNHRIEWGYDEVSQDRFQRFERGLPPKAKGNYAFISYMIKTLKEKTGRMGVVVSHGVLFRGAAEGKIRQKLSALKISVPPLNEQIQIAETLSTWDNAIQTTEKLIENSRQ